MVNKITTVVIDNETVYLKKSSLGWRVVHPIKHENGKINWFNLLVGGWENMIAVLFILFLTFIFFYIYWHDTHEMQQVVKNPCEYCSTANMQQMINLRLSERARVDAEARKFNIEAYSSTKVGDNS